MKKLLFNSDSHNGGLTWRLPLCLMITTLVTLCAELLYSRLISVLFFASDAYWIIAIALLGFGTGGAVVAVASRWFINRFDYLLPRLMWGIGLTALLPVVIFRHFKTEIIPGELHPKQYTLIFLFVSLCCLLIFLLASIFISMVFMHHRKIIGPLYFFDLLGSGLGCLFFVAFLTFFGLEYSLLLISALVILASLLMVRRFTMSTVSILVVMTILLVGCAVYMKGTSPLMPLIGRELRMLQDFHGENVKTEFQKWDPIARIDIVSLPGETLQIPDRAQYKLLTQDGGAPSILLRFDKPFQELEFPEQSLLGIAYWTRKSSSVLIIGPGGGPDVVVALRYKPQKITAVEMNKTTIDIVQKHFSEFVGGIYNRPEVSIVHDDGRHFIRASREKYDVIQLTGVDTTALATGGNLSENYLYTMEAFGDYFDHLSDNGMLSLTYPDLFNWGFRAIAMHLTLMKNRGLQFPEKHLHVSMSGGYINILLKKSPFTQSEVDTIAEHFTKPMYGLLPPLFYHLWGKQMPRSAFPLYVSQPHFQHPGSILYEPHKTRNNDYTGLITFWKKNPDSPVMSRIMGMSGPASDDRPFFFIPISVDLHFLQRVLWLVLPIVLFILIPLFLFQRKGMAIRGSLYNVIYFGSIGFAFIAVEMILLQKFVLFLGHPSYSFAVVLGILLVTAGFGSLWSQRMVDKPVKGVFLGISGIILFTVIFLLLMEPLTNALIQSILAVRITLVAALITPLGFCMGIFFPMGIHMLGKKAGDFVPWAWGINGSTSVLGSLFSLFLAIKLGFSKLMLIALAVYLLALLTAIKTSRNNP